MIKGLVREYRDIDPGQILGVSVVGIAGYYIASYLDLMGLQTISAGLERIILYTYPVFVVIFSALLLGRKISTPLCVCIAVIYGGLLLVFYADIHVQSTASLTATGAGAAYVLLSAIAFAIYVIGSDYYMRVFSSGLFTAIAMMAAALVMLLHYGCTGSMQHLFGLSTSVYIACAITALMFTVAPSFMMSAGVRAIGSAKAGGIGMIGPFATVILSGIFLGEVISALQIAGLAVVMFGVRRLHKL
jgi:drug/metabolite transporter (DMT)-like permease